MLRACTPVIAENERVPERATWVRRTDNMVQMRDSEVSGGCACGKFLLVAIILFIEFLFVLGPAT